MLKLYCGPISPFSAKVRIALAEKQLEYDRVDVAYSHRETMSGSYYPRHPEVVKLSPRNQVPLLVDGSIALYDSTVIIEYLDDRYPARPLIPGETEQRARCRQFEHYADEVLFPDVWTLIANVFYAGNGSAPDAAAIAVAHDNIAGHCAYLDGAIRNGDCLADEFSVADISAFLMVGLSARLGAQIDPELGNLGRWLQRIGERPTVAKDITEMEAFANSTPEEVSAAENG